ncbi:MFS sugar transporter-like protein [Cucurbitaria berberidis CBS 394.84]|uniref:MFS sugar transporter-like protein n=1 Tax=Cucurbitaria berberidis CBS 394.84 TaxID=1168544 RepID=A0A9P4L412_9PLEO|nr:MFS sugar transporter-like protein [Cucurbitaria berberidis CBS 394.84]KAF1841536.1 MFS sugar transporter-like protein [Cucurbitaria berberidis CBS 394.84]
MAPVGGASGFEAAALARRKALSGASGPMALLKNLRVFGIACFACLGGLLYGYNQGVFSGVLTMTSFKEHMGDYIKDPETLEWNSSKQGWLVAILELGAWFGTMYSGFLAEILSRKYAILVNVGIFIIGVIVQCTAVVGVGHNAILGGRFVTGMGVGSLSMIVPMYNAEIAPPEVRGALVGLQQLSITLGIMISFWIDYGTNFIGGTGRSQKEAAWLVPLSLQLAPALLLGVGMIFMPFSPRWLVHHDRELDALRVLARLRNLPQEHELIELEFAEIKAQSLFEKKSLRENFPHLQDMSAWSTFKLQFVAIGSLFTTRGMFKRVIIATLTMFFQQWTGINAILYYAPTIFKGLGLSSTSVSLLATGVVGIVMFIATIPAVMYVDSWGRKPTLIVGAIGMALCHIIVVSRAAIVGSFSDDWENHRGAGWAAVVMVWLFVIHFGYSWGPCAWIVIAEIWPLSNRPYGIALGASSNWMNNFIVGQVTPDMLEHMKYGTYIFFGLLTFLGAAFIYFYFPETKGLSLEEMDVLFGSVGTAEREKERWREVHAEVGLAELLARAGVYHDSGEHVSEIEKDKPIVAETKHEERKPVL